VGNLNRHNVYGVLSRHKQFQYFQVIDAMLAYKHAPEVAPLEDLASRVQSPTFRKTVLRES
jgi:hypothetical protein